MLMEQLAAQLPENLMNEARQIISQLKEGKQVATVSPELQSVFRPSVQPYMISWLAYNPQEEVAALEIPVLIIDGMNHVLKTVSDESGNEVAYSNPDLPLTAGLMEEIVRFLG